MSRLCRTSPRTPAAGSLTGLAEREPHRPCGERPRMYRRAMSMNSYVLGLSDADAGSLPLVGGKGANLGELLRIGGIAVPDGLALVTAS